MKRVWTLMAAALIGLLALGLWGCSNNNPMEGTPSTSSTYSTAAYLIAGDAVQYFGTIAEIDADNFILIVTGIDYPVIVPEDCDIATISQGEVVPLTFADLAVGDSVKVCGVYQEDETILANKIRICIPLDCPDYDLALHEEITAIDYFAGTFTVTNYDQTIVIDENTVIWGVNTHLMGDPGSSTESSASGPGSSKINPDQYNLHTHYSLDFTDLKVGDVVEVKAYYTDDPGILQAAVIKLAVEYNAARCITFVAALATIDCELRTVTFDGSDWGGWVCNGAVLTDAAGNAMDLCDFNIGDVVAVKGFPLDETTLQINTMTLQ
ncbi:MAG: DUF5666 domain-containing protein [Candidatus Zixiibacteriota bacterium]